jgi:hypothetical protein
MTPRKAVAAGLVALALLAGVGIPTQGQRAPRRGPQPYVAWLTVEITPAQDPQVICVGQTKELLGRVWFDALAKGELGRGLAVPVPIRYQAPAKSVGTSDSPGIARLTAKSPVKENYGAAEPLSRGPLRPYGRETRNGKAHVSGQSPTSAR